MTCEARLEHLRDREPANHLGRTPDVVALRMREHDGAQRVDAHAEQLAGDVGLGRALVDEDSRSARLEQHRVALPDVEERHAEARPVGSTPRAWSWRSMRWRRRASAGRERCPRPLAAATRAAAVAWRTTSHADSRADRKCERGVDIRLERPASRRRPERRARSQAAAQPASAASPAAAEGETGSTTAARSPNPSTSGAAGEREDVRRHRVHRRLAEVDEDDRRGREAAGEGDRERLGDGRRKRHAVELRRTRGTATKIAATAANESWKPGSRSDVGIHASSTSAPTARKCQRSRGREASHASDASAPATPARATDGCQPTASTYAAITPSVASSRSARESREEPAEQEDARREERDVLPRDGEQVVETGGAEVVLHVVRQPLVLAEHDTENDAAADAGRASPDGALDPVAKAISEAGNPAASADLPPARCVQDDVDALAREPAALVEPVLRAARLLDPDGRLEDGAPRRRAADGKHEEHALLYLCATERPRQRDDARRPGRRARRGDRDELRDARFAERRPPRTLSRSASIRSDPHASPRAARATPTATRRAPPPSISAHHDCRQRNRAGHRHRNRGPDREREPDARRADEERGPVELDDPPHGVTSSRSCSIRVGPMPGTASRSSTEANGPCSVR